MPVQTIDDASLRQRLWDLVRFQRSELFQAGLLSEEEYAELAEDHPAVARLESYDEMRLRLKQIKDLAIEGLQDANRGDSSVLLKIRSLLP